MPRTLKSILIGKGVDDMTSAIIAVLIVTALICWAAHAAGKWRLAEPDEFDGVRDE